VTDIMAEISAASNEQSAGIEQVNGAISQMDQVTQQNAALVEEAAAAAEAMQREAAELVQAVAVFKIAGQPGAVAPNAASAKAPQAPIASKSAPGRGVAVASSSRTIAPASRVQQHAGPEWEEF
jgi:uncharacterized phage infection (PIP) family protein YhgE